MLEIIALVVFCSVALVLVVVAIAALIHAISADDRGN